MHLFKLNSNSKLLLRKNYFRNVKKDATSSTSPEAVFIEKSLEEPVIAISERKCLDFIGPPDPISNLRPIIRGISVNETPMQLKLREMQKQTEEWNQQFWMKNNTKFIKERKDYIQNYLKGNSGKQTLTADEMSEFYKKFLDENWKTHVNYNFEWYRRNFALLMCALKVQAFNAFRL